MRKALVGTLLIAVAAVGCSDSLVDPQDESPRSPQTISFAHVTHDFTFPTSVEASDQGNRMFIPSVGFTAVMDDGACNDGTCASGEPNRSDPADALDPFDGEWFSLGLNVSDGELPGEGFVVVGFDSGVTGRAAVVWEQTFDTENYPNETAEVFGGHDASGPWTSLGTVGNKGTTDPACEDAGSADCTYEVMEPADVCYEYIRVENRTSPADYNDLNYVDGGEIIDEPGEGTYPGNDLIPDGFDLQAIAFESTCEPETGGCTSTQGYWQTHNESFRGGAPADETWEELGPDAEQTEFFDSGETYFDVIWAPVKGNKAMSLAHQYIAAELNLLAGASMPSDVEDAFNAATDWFTANATGDEFPVVEGDGGDLSDWHETLTAYNEGEIGPGHCDDVEEESDD